MKDKASSVKVGVADNNLTRGGHILHEQEHNTGHGVSAIPDEVRGNTASAGQAGSITKAGRISTFGRNAGTAEQNPWFASPGGPTAIQTSTQKQN